MSLPAQAGDLRPGDLSHLLYSGPVNESEPSTTAGSVEVALLVRLFGPLVHARLVLIVLLLALIAWVAVGDPALWRRQILIFVIRISFGFRIWCFGFSDARRGFNPRRPSCQAHHAERVGYFRVSASAECLVSAECDAQ